MPVMIKYNEATECGVTNGAEATVVDWISSAIEGTDKEALDILFVLAAELVYTGLGLTGMLSMDHWSPG